MNGIPLCVIECKRPDLEDNDPMAKAISQPIHYQKDDGIPRLYVYAQLLLAISKNDAKYAATGSGSMPRSRRRSASSGRTSVS